LFPCKSHKPYRFTSFGHEPSPEAHEGLASIQRIRSCGRSERLIIVMRNEGPDQEAGRVRENGQAVPPAPAATATATAEETAAVSERGGKGEEEQQVSAS
jgi:hypothetical protein